MAQKRGVFKTMYCTTIFFFVFKDYDENMQASKERSENFWIDEKGIQCDQRQKYDLNTK